MTDFDRERILAVISRLAWRFARTMPNQPHEYVVRSLENEADFTALFHAIREAGVRQKYVPTDGRRPYWNRYLWPGDGHKYWAMTTSARQSRIINRAKVEAS
jgi:hypothetical protein